MSILNKAKAGNYAVPGMCCYNIESIIATVRAAEAANSPAMVLLFPWAIEYAGDSLVKAAADAAHTPARIRRRVSPASDPAAGLFPAAGSGLPVPDPAATRPSWPPLSAAAVGASPPPEPLPRRIPSWLPRRPRCVRAKEQSQEGIRRRWPKGEKAEAAQLDSTTVAERRGQEGRVAAGSGAGSPDPAAGKSPAAGS